MLNAHFHGLLLLHNLNACYITQMHVYRGRIVCVYVGHVLDFVATVLKMDISR
jgi:hypothetical protein